MKQNNVIIPAYNEAAVMSDVYKQAQQTLPQWDLLVVSDGSVDATASLARAVISFARSEHCSPEIGATRTP